MPSVTVSQADLKPFGDKWLENNQALSRTPPYSSGNLGQLFDSRVAAALAEMLGALPIVTPISSHLGPAEVDCVEVGPLRIVGGVRPQNFDVGYRPDGVRIAFDSKTLNDTKSVGKNYQNMINDLATEATTVHSRFPMALVAFMVIVPKPCLKAQAAAIVGTLERITGRRAIDDPLHLAEAISFVVWDPAVGDVIPDLPIQVSPLRLERFSEQVETTYRARYKGLPPHALE